MVALTASVLGWLTVLLPTALARRFPGQPLPEYARSLLGRHWAGAVLLLYALAGALSMGIDLAISVRVVLGLFLQHTPAWAVLGLGVLVAVLAAANGMVRLAQVAPSFLLFLVAGHVALVGFLWPELDPGYLMPWWQAEPGLWNRSTFWAAVAAFRGLLVLPAMLSCLRAPHQAPRLVSAGYWLGWVILLPAFMVPLLLLGPHGARTVEHPLLAALAAIKAPNFPVVERLELLLRPVGNISALVTVGATLNAAAEAAGALVGNRSKAWVKPALVALACVAAGILLRQANVWVAIQWPLFAIAIVILPLFLYLWLRAATLRTAGTDPSPQR